MRLWFPRLTRMPLLPTPTTFVPRIRLKRFWEKVDRRGPDECWEWTASVKPNGYGQFSVVRDGKWLKSYAHRYGYELIVGPIPEGGCSLTTCAVTRHA